MGHLDTPLSVFLSANVCVHFKCLRRGGCLTLDALHECVTCVYFNPLGALMTKHTHADGGPCEEDSLSSSPVEEPVL